MQMRGVDLQGYHSNAQDFNWNIPHGLSILTSQFDENILMINLSFEYTTTDELIWT